MRSSFISERSAEYILIPQFSEQLLLLSKKIIPIYHWVSREGSNLSKESLKNKPIKLVAFFARRPKVSFIDSEQIEVKFNSELFDKTEYLTKHGITVFSGVPLVTKLDDVRLGANCKWFNLQSTAIKSDEYVLIDKSGKVLDERTKNIREVTSNGIVEIINNKSAQLAWTTAVDIIRNMNQNLTNNKRWFFAGGYKPVYFIVDCSEHCRQ
ncbi:MAG: hypothetical protein ACE3K2_28800 [Paenibacillus sp.]|uniref:hypothetical protein n=1 Tax=Paenibacillus sp. TaxID=58172 RepID=UPI003B7D4C58